MVVVVAMNKYYGSLIKMKGPYEHVENCVHHQESSEYEENSPHFNLFVDTLYWVGESTFDDIAHIY